MREEVEIGGRRGCQISAQLAEQREVPTSKPHNGSTRMLYNVPKETAHFSLYK
jgi:hypothetical protein